MEFLHRSIPQFLERLQKETFYFQKLKETAFKEFDEQNISDPTGSKRLSLTNEWMEKELCLVKDQQEKMEFRLKTIDNELFPDQEQEDEKTVRLRDGLAQLRKSFQEKADKASQELDAKYEERKKAFEIDCERIGKGLPPITFHYLAERDDLQVEEVALKAEIDHEFRELNTQLRKEWDQAVEQLENTINQKEQPSTKKSKEEIKAQIYRIAQGEKNNGQEQEHSK